MSRTQLYAAITAVLWAARRCDMSVVIENGSGKFLMPGIVNSHAHIRGFVPPPNTTDPALMKDCW